MIKTPEKTIGLLKDEARKRGWVDTRVNRVEPPGTDGKGLGGRGKAIEIGCSYGQIRIRFTLDREDIRAVDIVNDDQIPAALEAVQNWVEVGD